MWIAHPFSDADREKPNYADYVRDVRFPDDAEETECLISAFSNYQLFINGRLIGRGPAVGHRKLAYFDRWGVDTSRLKGSVVRVAVRVFHEGTETGSAQGFDYGVHGLLCALRANGDTFACSDGKWLSRISPEYPGDIQALSFWGGFKEFWHEDSVDNWTQGHFDLSGWGHAKALDSALDSTIASEPRSTDTKGLVSVRVEPKRLVAACPQMGIIRLDGEQVEGLAGADLPERIEVEPNEALATPELVWDFGWVHTGYTDIELSGAAGVVEIHYGETLDTLRADVLHFTEGYTRWQSFQRRAFRFLRLRFIALLGPVRMEHVGVTESVYDYETDVALDCDGAGFNELVEVSRRTLRACSSYHYEDCPWREQALWTVDVRIAGRANAYLYGNNEVTAKSIRQLLSMQREDGALGACGPKFAKFYFLDFMLHLAPMVHEYYQVTGDLSLVQDALPVLRRLTEFAQGLRNSDGLLELTEATRQREIGVFFDWSKTIQRLGCTTILNALYVDHLAKKAELEALAGDPTRSDKLRARMQSIQEVAPAVFFDSERGLYREADLATVANPQYVLQSNIAALFAGFADDAEAQSVMKQMCTGDSIARPHGPSFYMFVFDVMQRIGLTEELSHWMQDYWGEMLRRGATTWWEVFAPNQSPSAYPHPYLGQTPTYQREEVPVSNCHAWSCLPGYVIPQYLLGVDLSRIHAGEIGWRSQTRALMEKADYRVHTAAGPLHLKFKRNADRYDLSVVEAPLPIKEIQ